MKLESAMSSMSGEHRDDPVFKGIVRDFLALDHTFCDLHKGILTFGKSLDRFCDSLTTLSETIVENFAKNSETMIVSDCCKFREATQLIARQDAPYSAVAKLTRDMDFNVMTPLRKHIAHNAELREKLELRSHRLLQLQTAEKALNQLLKDNSKRDEDKYMNAQERFDTAKQKFDEVDRPSFEWLMMLEEYKCDVYDSFLQTIKYLQYEFFSTASNAISGILPARMEFRPLIEMVPEHLEAQVEMEMEAAEEAGNNSKTSDIDRETSEENENSSDESGESDSEIEKEKQPRLHVMKRHVADTTAKLVQKWERDSELRHSSQPDIEIDPLSLSVLTCQGFGEADSRKALRECNNDTQKALDWLLNGRDAEADVTGENSANVQSDYVRIPKTLKWVYKLRARRKKALAKRGDDESLLNSDDDLVESDTKSQTLLSARSNEGKFIAPDLTDRPVFVEKEVRSSKSSVGNRRSGDALIDFDEVVSPGASEGTAKDRSKKKKPHDGETDSSKNDLIDMIQSPVRSKKDKDKRESRPQSIGKHHKDEDTAPALLSQLLESLSSNPSTPSKATQNISVKSDERSQTLPSRKGSTSGIGSGEILSPDVDPTGITSPAPASGNSTGLSPHQLDLLGECLVAEKQPSAPAATLSHSNNALKSNNLSDLFFLYDATSTSAVSQKDPEKANTRTGSPPGDVKEAKISVLNQGEGNALGMLIESSASTSTPSQRRTESCRNDCLLESSNNSPAYLLSPTSSVNSAVRLDNSADMLSENTSANKKSDVDARFEQFLNAMGSNKAISVNDANVKSDLLRSSDEDCAIKPKSASDDYHSLFAKQVQEFLS